MSRPIKEMMPSERPRERLIERGPGVLTDAELLAILMRTGRLGINVVAEAEQLLVDAGGLVEVARMNVGDLWARPGFGAAKAATLVAALELGRRLARAEVKKSCRLSDPDAAGAYLVKLLRHERREVVGFLSLDSRHRLLRQRDLVIGTRSSAPVDTGEVIRQALQDHAAGVVLFHNHPSGELTPSRDDIELTRRLVTACASVSVPLLDHLVVADDQWLSLRVSQPAIFEAAV
jgi:DNA repair protein RadC